MKSALRVFASALLLGSAPALAAQDMPQEVMAAAGEAMAESWAADPLTPEQEARVPAATKVVDSLFPVGTYREMMNDTIGPMTRSMVGAASQVPFSVMSASIGLSEEEAEGMSDATIGEVMALIDPAFEERVALSSGITTDLMDAVVDRIEPSMRAGLMRAYASRFTEAQLTEMQGFFETETGASFAKQSYLIFADPQVISAMGEAMPVIMEVMPDIMTKLEEDMAALPAPRSYSDLSEDEQQQLADLLGMTQEQLQERESELFGEF
jgi:hypothetical protein